MKDFYDAQETFYYSSCYCVGSAGRILQLILYVLSTLFASGYLLFYSSPLVPHLTKNLPPFCWLFGRGGCGNIVRDSKMPTFWVLTTGSTRCIADLEAGRIPEW